MFHEEDEDVPECVVRELTRASLANCNLEDLDLSTEENDLVWDPHLATLFEGLKYHKGLRTLTVSVKDSAFGPQYSLLRQFLSQNGNIRVIDDYGIIHTDGSTIDELYSLNRFYRGSSELMVASSLERSSLVATALLEVASKDFQRFALLMSNHIDVLYDFAHFADFDELTETSPSLRTRGNIQKRRRKA
jgi:hypothetical protein